MDNPFVIRAYRSKELFCDRRKELQMMMRNCENGSNMTLMSQRRIGKTGLIQRLFDELHSESPEVYTIYFDVFATRGIEDFIRMMAEAAMKVFRPKTTIGERFMSFVRSLRPQITFDSITGDPQLQIAYQSAAEREYTLKGLIDFLDGQGVPIVIAIDEFQQIRSYAGVNMEALLRTYIQHTRNLTFIFCGSKKHLMADIFGNEQRPFYSSTTFVPLGKIEKTEYAAFIDRLMRECGREMSEEAIDFVLEWTRCHTYYTQQLCHTVFAEGRTKVELKDVKGACEELMRQGEPVYLQYRQMLTDRQWEYLIAVAKEGSVRQITSASFLKRYGIGSPSVSRRIADSLCEKGLLNDEATIDGTIYTVNDVFMSHWMERL